MSAVRNKEGRFSKRPAAVEKPPLLALLTGRVAHSREDFPVSVTNASGTRRLGVRWQSEAATPALGMTLHVQWTPTPKAAWRYRFPPHSKAGFPVKQFRIIRRLWLRKSRAASIASRLAGTVCLTGLLCCATAFQSCSLGKAPLPKRASLEPGSRPGGEADYAALVAKADIIYFPRDRAASGARSEPAALLLEAMLQQGAPFAIAWDMAEAVQQPLLDDLAGKTGQAREEFAEKVDLSGTGRAREYCRAVLRDGRFARHLALAFPPGLLARFTGAEKLSPEEEAQLPAGFAPPRDGLGAYAERFANCGDLNQRAIVRAYRSHVMRQQFAAEQMVRYFQGAAGGGKLLVFIRGEDLAGDGVPYYVAQKIQLRQLVLDSAATAPPRPRLLAKR